jgi:hypothetical protein
MKVKVIDNYKALPKGAKKVYKMMGLVAVVAIIAIINLVGVGVGDVEPEQLAPKTEAVTKFNISTQRSEVSTDLSNLDVNFQQELKDNEKKNKEKAKLSGKSYAPPADLVKWSGNEDNIENIIDKEVEASNDDIEASKNSNKIEYRKLSKEQMVNFYQEKKETLTQLNEYWGQASETNSKVYERESDSQTASRSERTDALRDETDQENIDFVGMLPGDEIMVALRIATNTDVTSHVTLDLLDGPFKGGIATATVSQKNGYAVYQTKYISYKKKYFSAEAILVDVQSKYGSTGFSDDTDWHTLFRYGNLFASGLSELPQMVLQDGSTEIVDNGVIISQTKEYETKDYVIAAVGGVAEKFAEVAKENFNTPPTVKVEKNHLGKLIFIEPTEVTWLK